MTDKDREDKLAAKLERNKQAARGSTEPTGKTKPAGGADSLGDSGAR